MVFSIFSERLGLSVDRSRLAVLWAIGYCFLEEALSTALIAMVVALR
jgi:hypothetical protein